MEITVESLKNDDIGLNAESLP